MNKSGIYKITNLANGKYYYGSSCNLKVRLNKHKSDLLAGRHDNKHLQAAYNKYGIDSFKYEIVLYCSKTDCYLYEQRILDVYWDGGLLCYNIAKDAKAPTRGQKLSEETKNKISVATIGKPKSDKTKQAMSEAMLGNTKWLGKIHSEETKFKMKKPKANTDNMKQPKSEDHKKSLRLAWIQRRLKMENANGC